MTSPWGRRVRVQTVAASVAAVIDDIVEGFEDTVREPVLSHELPDFFLAVEFGCARRQRHERNIARDLENLAASQPA